MKRGGTTLIELMITVAIISVLAGLLMSSVSHAIRQARLVECRNFQRQLKIYEAVGRSGLEFRNERVYLGGLLVSKNCYDCHPSIP